MHYGPQAEDFVATPASERRLSDPEVGSWEDSRSQWSATPPWIADNTWSSSKDQLPARAFNDGGPPYSEDEDLQSPIVTTARHRKKSERGRSPGAAGSNRGIILGADGDSIEEYHPTDGDELDGPGGEIETYPRRTKHRDSNFAKPLQRQEDTLYKNQYEEVSEEYDSDEEARYSKDYSFTIASPDEEMHGKAVALFDFMSEHENELALREGQIILVSYRHGQGWLVAEDPVTGESGLVPEEFVRLLRHIEGGLHGLNAVDFEEGEVTSPTSNDPGSAMTPTNPVEGFEKQPAVQSNFSTSTRDFSPMPRSAKPDKDEQDR